MAEEMTLDVGGTPEELALAVPLAASDEATPAEPALVVLDKSIPWFDVFGVLETAGEPTLGLENARLEALGVLETAGEPTLELKGARLEALGVLETAGEPKLALECVTIGDEPALVEPEIAWEPTLALEGAKLADEPALVDAEGAGEATNELEIGLPTEDTLD